MDLQPWTSNPDGPCSPQELWDNCKALWTIWVPAQLVNFAFVPRHLRIPFGACFSFFHALAQKGGSPVGRRVRGFEAAKGGGMQRRGLTNAPPAHALWPRRRAARLLL